MAGLLGRKIGMTRFYTEDEVSVPVTIIESEGCFVSQIKTPESDGYAAIQVAFEDVKPRRSTVPLIGHDHQAGLSPKRYHREFRIDEDQLGQYELGQRLGVDLFEDVMFVDVAGTSKGKGTAGVIKRHNFKGQLASHGVERKHRSPGSISSHASNAGGSGGIKRGKKMAGRMGNERVTVRNLDVLAIDKEQNLIIVKGPIPGPNDGMVSLTEAKRLYKVKQNRIAAAGK